MSKYIENPDQIFINIGLMIDEGVKNRKHGFHTPVFSNFSAQSKMNSRVVVLRNYDRVKQILYFNTDFRSKKVKEIKNNPNTFFVFYDFKEKVQLRIETLSIINHKNAISLEAWEKTKLSSRKCYLSSLAPGTNSNKPSDGIPQKFIGIEPRKNESEVGYNNFSVIKNTIKKIEWLNLSSKGHRKLLIKLDKVRKYQWLIP